MELTLNEALQRGIAAHREGNLQDAERFYLAVLQAHPHHPDANHNLGVLAVAVGEYEAALPLLKNALDTNSATEQFWLSYIDCLIKAESFEVAKQTLVEAKKAGVSEGNLSPLKLVLKSSSQEVDSLKKRALSSSKKRQKNLNRRQVSRQAQGVHSPSRQQLDDLQRYYQSGRLDEFERLAILITEEFPAHHVGWKALGVVRQQTGRLSESLAPMQQAVKLAPGDVEAHCNLGLVLSELSLFEQAASSYRKAAAINPEHLSAQNDLGVVLLELGKLEEALACFSKVIAREPSHIEAHSNLGFTLQKMGRLDEAESSCRKAIELNPEFVSAHNNLVTVLELQCRYDEAVVCYDKAAALKAKLPELHNNVGLALLGLGRFAEAETNFREAIHLNSRFFNAHDNLLFCLNYDARLSAEELLNEYEAYGEWLTLLTQHQFDHVDHPPVNGRRIRVGYSSPDFRGHACRFFMEPLFRNHDRDQFELFAYSNTLNPDQHTERMKGYFDHWVDVVGMTDEEMAQRIYDDQVDILVDMAGHTKGNRLPVFAMRPAPIQASSCTGYAYTTGLKEVDYFICDENMVPEGSECYFSEEPWRLPAPAEPYDPPREEAPDVSELPALRNGYVTFGSLTRTVRINDPLLRVWSEILERVPNSRLRLDQKPFAHEGTRELFWKRLEGLGLPRDRVDLTCSPSHWTAYHDIDITLDCWPHNAGTTTLESLWMGVPVLSKMDRPSVGRIGATVLKPLGLEDWLVETAEAYVEKAVSFASDLDALSELRAELRDRVDQGPHLDGATITGHLENVYREMLSLVRSPNR